MGLFYTGQGDKGKSAVGKRKISKTCKEVAALMALDELNSLLGLVKTQKLPANIKKIVHSIQEDLFIIQANVASLMIADTKLPPPLKKEKVKKLERWTDDFEKKVNPQRSFIIYGASKPSAWLHYVRAVARRVEVEIIRLNQQTKNGLKPPILAYLNRLSSVLYAAARYLVVKEGKTERHPLYK